MEDNEMYGDFSKGYDKMEKKMEHLLLEILQIM